MSLNTEINTSAFLEFSDYQDSDARIKVNYFSIESCNASENLSIETLVEEMKLTVSKKSESENRDESISIAFFLEISDDEENDTSE